MITTLGAKSFGNAFLDRRKRMHQEMQTRFLQGKAKRDVDDIMGIYHYKQDKPIKPILHCDYCGSDMSENKNWKCPNCGAGLKRERSAK